jgi:hypothetical protein
MSGVPCNPRCQKLLGQISCRQHWQLDADAATCSAQRGSCWLLKQPEELYELALQLARSRDYVRARTAFEVLLSSSPQLCRAWVSYAQVRPLARLHVMTQAPWRSSVLAAPSSGVRAAAAGACTRGLLLLTAPRTSCPQMEKRSRGLRTPESFDRCRQVLQRGLQLNPDSACLAQVRARDIASMA